MPAICFFFCIDPISVPLSWQFAANEANCQITDRKQITNTVHMQFSVKVIFFINAYNDALLEASLDGDTED